MIEPADLISGHAFSFEHQPYLRTLFEMITSDDRPITLVVGAGVSMNAGLPSWLALLERMSDGLTEPFRTMVRSDSADAPRKAERVMQLVRAGNHNALEFEFVRDALYPKDSVVQPGDLARSIARLIAAGEGRIRVVTTNYDIVLEEALRSLLPDATVNSYGLSRADQWLSAVTTDDATTVSVLHLHGLVRQGQDPELPIVLSESHFLRHGTDVRERLTHVLTTSHTVFVGLSITDPNVVGPLFDRASMSRQEAGDPLPQAFTLTVPDPVVGATSWDDEVAYAIESAKYLDGKLALRPIFLKSYSQLNQVVSDLALARRHPKQYRAVPGGRQPSLLYGKRFDAALASCYTAVGCSPRTDVPTGEPAADLHRRLHEALHAKDGPAKFLGIAAHAPSGPGTDEHLALFLWLRSRAPRGRTAPYAITLVGSSAYLHREAWTTTQNVPINRRSPYSAVQAVFNGSLQVANLEPRPHSNTWRGIVAYPVVLEAARSETRIGKASADVLTVGVLTLNSTHLATLEGDSPDGPRSVLSRLSTADYQQLADRLDRVVQTVLTPSTAGRAQTR